MQPSIPTARLKTRHRSRLPIAFIIASVVPALLLTVYFTLLPTVRALFMSFTDSTSAGMSGYSFVGLDNYTYMFHDRRFLQALFNTFRLMLVVPVVTIFISVILASLLTQSKLCGKSMFRTVFFFPSIISMTVIAIIWSFVFHPTMGILNTLLNAIGLGGLASPWLGNSSTALWCIGITLVWQAAGYYMVMHIAAIDGIPAEIYEASKIDGASGIRQFFSITLPIIRNIVGITYVLSLSGTINLSFVLSRVMTGGGPNGASTVLLQYMYNQGMGNANFGYSMAIAVFTLGISIVLSIASRLLTDSREKGV